MKSNEEMFKDIIDRRNNEQNKKSKKNTTIIGICTAGAAVLIGIILLVNGKDNRNMNKPATENSVITGVQAHENQADVTQADSVTNTKPTDDPAKTTASDPTDDNSAQVTPDNQTVSTPAEEPAESEWKTASEIISETAQTMGVYVPSYIVVNGSFYWIKGEEAVDDALFKETGSVVYFNYNTYTGQVKDGAHKVYQPKEDWLSGDKAVVCNKMELYSPVFDVIFDANGKTYGMAVSISPQEFTLGKKICETDGYSAYSAVLKNGDTNVVVVNILPLLKKYFPAVAEDMGDTWDAIWHLAAETHGNANH